MYMYIYIYTHTHTYIHIYIYILVCRMLVAAVEVNKVVELFAVNEAAPLDTYIYIYIHTYIYNSV